MSERDRTVGTLFGMTVRLDPETPRGIVEVTQWDEKMDTGVVIAAFDLRGAEPVLMRGEAFDEVATKGEGHAYG